VYVVRGVGNQAVQGCPEDLQDYMMPIAQGAELEWTLLDNLK